MTAASRSAGPGFEYVLDRATGLFESMTFEGRDLLTRPMEANVFRAPTDNDMYVKAKWELAQLPSRPRIRLQHRVRRRAGRRDGDRVDGARGAGGAADGPHGDNVAWVPRVPSIWTCGCAGMSIPRKLPRFELRLFLDRGMDQVTYYGLGPHESYPDKHRASSHGRYTSSVAGLHVDYPDRRKTVTTTAATA